MSSSQGGKLHIFLYNMQPAANMLTSHEAPNGNKKIQFAILTAIEIYLLFGDASPLYC